MKRLLPLLLVLCGCGEEITGPPEGLCVQWSYHGDANLSEFLAEYSVAIYEHAEGASCADVTVYRSDGEQFVWHINLRGS